MTDTPPPELAELAQIRHKLTDAEGVVDELRGVRDDLICSARVAGATGDELAEASGVSRQTVHGVLRERHVAAPNRSRFTYQRRVRAELRRALEAAGIILGAHDNPEDVGRAVADILRTEPEE